MLKKSYFFAFILVLLPLLGCNVPASAADETTPASGGTLSIVSSEIPFTLGYAPDTNFEYFDMVSPAVERLLDVKLNRDMENSLEPVLAESVEEDINQKMITFHIRQGVKFHDGSYLDAQAVAKNFEMFIDADRLPYQNYFEGIATPNDDTVIIKYGEYNNMLLPSWGRMPIISSESYREHSRDGGVEEYREWARTHVVGTGPFMLGEFVNGEHINWVRNPDYWKTGKPYLDSIKVWLIADTLTSQAMMEAEEADEWDGVPAKHVNDLVQKGFIDINGPYGSPFALCPDTTDPTSPWNKLKVRQALEYVLDKPEMLRSLEYNDIEPMNMIAPPGEWGYDPDYQARFFDPAKAKQLLVESGYPNGFNTKMLILNDYVNGEIGELVQAQARQIGINITLDTADPGRYYTELRKGPTNSGLVLFNYALDTNSYNTYMRWFSSDPINEIASIGHTTEQIALDETACEITNTIEKQKITYLFARYIADNALVIPLWNSPDTAIAQPYVHTTRYAQGTMRWQSEDAYMDGAIRKYLVLSGNPSSITAGNSYTLTVTARDSDNNIVNDYAGTVSLTSDDTQAVFSPVSHTFNPAVDKGSFNFRITLRTAGLKTITVKDNVNNLLVTHSIQVNAAEAARLTVDGVLSPIAVGHPTHLYVIATDRFGNASDSYRGTVYITSTDSQIEKPADYTFQPADKGIHYFIDSIVFHTKGVHSVTVADLDNPQICGSQTDILVGITAPQVATNPTWATGSGEVFIQGRLDSLGSAESVQVFFEYWPRPEATGGNAASGAGGGGGGGTGPPADMITVPGIPPVISSIPSDGAPFHANLTGLDLSKYYYFRAKAVGDGVTVYGSLVTLHINKTFINFSTSPLTLTAGAVSGAITIQNQNSSGSPVNVSADTVISLTASSDQGRFDTSAAGAFDSSISQVTIPAGHNQASFYYKDTQAGTSSISANSPGYTSISQPVAVTAAVASQIRVETKADGSGTVVPAQTVYIGKSITVYGITRDQYGNFVGNPEANWSLTSISGSVLATDLSAAAGTSVIFTGHKAGSAVIHVEITDLTSVDSGTITVKKKSPSSSSSGGGGGGAPPPAAPSLQASGLNSTAPVTMNTDGTTKAAAQYKTGDSKLILDIASGTKLTNSQGKTLTTLSAAVLANPPAPPESSAILLAYEFGPEGAAFTPALTLTFSYGTLPEGAKNLKLVYWNGSIWEQVEASVDAAKGTVIASISHFSKYALLYQLPSPANIAFTGITISPQAVKPDEKVTIQASVTNSGDLSGSYKLVLKINDRQVDSKEVTVAGGKTETVSFEVQRGMEGEYSVDVNSQKGKFIVGTTVETPPPATIAEITATPGTIYTPLANSGNTSTPTTVKEPVPSATVVAAPVNPSPSPAAASPASQNEEKPAAPVLWIAIGIVVVIALLVVLMLILNKRKKQST